MKAIMISIKPKWVAKILNGEKTIEIRKTCPEIFKHLKPYEGCSIDVYIYCTKDKPYLANATELFTGKYACISNDEVSYKEHNLNGKVVAKFTLKRIKTSDMTNCLQGSCLSYDEVSEYTKGKKFYGWVIDNLVIFDKPKELSEFNHWTDKKIQWYSVGEKVKVMVSLTNAPQNYCYVEVGK